MHHAERDPLYQKLLAFEIDDGPAVFGFHDRLAREQGWHPSHAARVIVEYKRFLYLCATERLPMSPSYAVDQAWHLHLTYTRSYWERLCRDVLPAPLHHDPSLGGRQEQAKFDQWYERTLAAYRQAFGAEPPADIWPPTHLRFDADTRTRHVDTRGCRVLPRPWAWLAARRDAVMTTAAFLAGTLLLIGCSRAGGALGALWLLGAVIVMLTVFRISRGGGDGRGGHHGYGNHIDHGGSLGGLHHHGSHHHHGSGDSSCDAGGDSSGGGCDTGGDSGGGGGGCGGGGGGCGGGGGGCGGGGY
jgi:hypothetical protein